MRIRGPLIWLALAIALVGCGSEPSATSVTSTTMPNATTTEPSDTPDPVVAAAITNLAERLDIPEADIEIVWSAEVSWPNGALGCPEPGMMYTQAIVEGIQTVLSAGDRYFDYHSGSQGEPFLCESGAEDGGYDTPPNPPGSTS